ncbi:hypothetical protein MmarC5_1122 [Methanococcus maripaludis C5]|uniref:Uncharacterized protein n=1 Tax=Methanococcus maripaludis (strain C5 / ATCC BAA-1333) TaxID=402880 RepID=A4FYY9_METM5|nr:hypothetical protein [Methanococcus maripaludis]ABO35423.1 hypothetical protein MmarC5_1122 [Methanococcus maripaludis C5]
MARNRELGPYKVFTMKMEKSDEKCLLKIIEHSEEYKNYADFFRGQIRKVFENLTLFAENELLKFQLKQKDREIETLIKTKNLELEEKDRIIEELQTRLLERTIVPESSENCRKGHLKNFNRILELMFTDDWENTPERVKISLRPKITEKIFQLIELLNKALEKLENEETIKKGD